MSNSGYVFADWAGIEDDDNNNDYTPMRKYNYRLETGYVGTDNDDIANVLYNINRMEINANAKFSDAAQLQESLFDLSFLLAGSMVHLDDFLEMYQQEDNELAKTILAVYEKAMEIVDLAIEHSPNLKKMLDVDAFSTVYKNLLELVPSIIHLDETIRCMPKNGSEENTEEALSQSVRRLSKEIERHPNNADLYFKRGMAYYEHNQIFNAEKDLTLALELEPNSTDFLHTRGLIYFAQEDYEKAISDFSVAIALKPVNEDDILHSRGRAYMKQEKYEKASEDFGRTLEINPNNVDAIYSCGIILMEQEDYDGAADFFSLALELTPDDGNIYYDRGRAYMNDEEYEDAIKDFTKALELEADYSDNIYYDRGMVYLEMENYENAVADFTKSMELGQSDMDIVLNARGLSYLKLNEYEMAIDDFTLALTFEPDNMDNILYSRASTYRQLEKYDEAIADFSRVIELNKGDEYVVFQARGLCYQDCKDHEKAIQDFEIAVKLDTENVEKSNSCHYLGTSYMEKKDYAKAVENFENAVAFFVNEDRANDEDDVEYAENIAKYKKSVIDAYENLQQEQFPFEERILPYSKMIEQIKNEIAKGNKDFNYGKFFNFKQKEEYTEFAAVLAFYEEYDLLKCFLEQGTEFKDFDILNSHVRPKLAWWQPTPLYFITGKKAVRTMKDPHKMLRFLVSNGADVNMTGGDGSTPLWNQTTESGIIEVFQTLLEIGANPDAKSASGDIIFTPLTSCLLGDPGENIDEDENDWLPISEPSLKKAKLLIEHGADVNLISPSMPDFSPLMLAVYYGFPRFREENEPLSADVLEIIELLLKKGANPNFTNSEGQNSLSICEEKNLLEAGQLLLLYGAEMPKPAVKYTPTPESGLKYLAEIFNTLDDNKWCIAQEEFFFKMEELLNSKTKTFKDMVYYEIHFKEKTPASFKGEIWFNDYGHNMKKNVGKFVVNPENPKYVSEFSEKYSEKYDETNYIRLTLELVENNEVNVDRRLELMREKYESKSAFGEDSTVQELLDSLSSDIMGDNAIVNCGVYAQDLADCDEKLSALGYPELPDDYADFLKEHSGYAFNSVELYGVKKVTFNNSDFVIEDIISATTDFNTRYVDEVYLDTDYYLLCIGRQNGDYFTYDPCTCKYQVRSHECISDVWNEYDTFEEFFIKESWING